MRIKQITVRSLFDTFNYDIPLNLNDGITIMIGPNGFGKSMILRMLGGMLRGKFSLFDKIPVSEFIVETDNGYSIQIEKRPTKKKKQISVSTELVLRIKSPDKKEEVISLTDFTKIRPSDLFYLSRRMVDEDIIDRRTWANIRHGIEIDNLSIYEKLYEYLVSETAERKDIYQELSPHVLAEFKDRFEKIRQITNNINVHHIKTQRLISQRRNDAEKITNSQMPSVKLYSDELSQKIGDKLKEYTQRAQTLDSTFPRRVITQSPKSISPQSDAMEVYKTLLSKLEVLREKRLHLKEAGIFVDLGEELDIPELMKVDWAEFLNGVLTEYANDTEAKLSVFDELANKIELLKRIINSRFVNKEFTINKDKGFIFITPNGFELAPEDLSSGEQHELVLLYELLFKIPAGSLVLIDEPELSLHIAWQQQFLEDLIEIRDIAKFDVLIATHAPDIIHNHWYLTVDLGEQINEQ